MDRGLGVVTNSIGGMQRTGLEWTHRVCSEPIRLDKRYASGNSRFFALLLPELIRFNAFRKKLTIRGSTMRRDIWP
jgi:hypothetical protein